MRNFDRDAARSKRLIRQFLEEDPAGFLRAAVRIFKSDMDSRGARQLIGELVASGMLLATLGDPGITQAEAFALARAALSLDPNVDVSLARNLADLASEAEGERTFEQHSRILEILATLSDPARIFPSLMRLMRHPNPYLRSKAVLMIGKGNRSAKWLRQRLVDTDPRIRANAAEALWGVDTEEARELLHSLAHDANNRVAGNALLGLYRLGESSAIPEILAIAHDQSAAFRATAAWVMGETRDPRFTETLAVLLREPNLVVRKRAFAALGILRAAIAQSQQGRSWQIVARLLDQEPGRSARRLVLGIAGEQGAATPALLPTQIFLAEDAQAVTHYRVVERPAPDNPPVVFVVPCSGGSVARECLPWKRPSTLWRILYHHTEPQHAGAPRTYIHSWESPGPDGDGPRFQSSAEAIAAELDHAPAPEACPEIWGAIARAVSAEGGIAGRRMVIVATDRPVVKGAPDDLVAAVGASQAFLQALSIGRDPALEEFCRRVNGLFRLAEPGAAVQAYLQPCTGHEVCWQPVQPDAHVLRIRVHGPDFCSEMRLPLMASA